MYETSEIHRSASGVVDTQHYIREAHALRSEAIRHAASAFARSIKRGIKAWKSWHAPAPEFPTHFTRPAE